eukprot:c24806_g1_i1 orf=614-1699(+)
MADRSSSSRRPRMNWAVLNRLRTNAANGASSTSAALLPNPESLLLHIDNAIANTEHAQATHHLSLLFATPPSASPSSSSVPGESRISHPQLRVFSSSVPAREAGESKFPKHSTVSEPPFVKATSKPRAMLASRFYPAHHEALPPGSQSRPTIEGEKSKRGSRTRSTLSGLANGLLSPEYLDKTVYSKDGATAPTAARKLHLEELTAMSSERKKTAEIISTELEKTTISDERIARDESQKDDQVQTSHCPALLLDSPNSVTKCEGAAGEKFSDVLGRLQSADTEVDYDAQAADDAYRAGCSALSEGNMDLALSLLKVASSKCPPDKHFALAKIQHLIAAMSQLSEKEEVNKKGKMVGNATTS